ncbi:MAG TPA: 50S ribosomal protein L11 methyltransferase [Bacteroidetes bacterium]|nr:50S ribosomal protein L11 methyltransferase [Bacteroidota bacterium]
MTKENHIKVSIELSDDQHETMMAILAEIGFYAFEENPGNLDAYILEADYNDAALQREVSRFFPKLYLKRTVELILSKDWNAEWEKDFQPVRVENFCLVRPPFKPAEPGFSHEVIVFPKMAFGTGHHATTWLVIDQCSRMDFAGKRVLDMGCGTGVLGILACKLGAKEVTGIDIDVWSYENARENAELNQVEQFEVLQGDAEAIPEGCYDIILANINRNVLLADRDKYIAHLVSGGNLILSGIYNFDEAKLADHYQAGGLQQVLRKERNEWVMLAFEKK